MSEISEANVHEPEPLTQDDQLQYTQRMRHRVVQKITNGGHAIPSEAKEVYALLTALDGMDRQSVNLKKIGAQERSNEADRLAAATIAKMNARLGGLHPFERPVIDGEFTEVKAPSLDTREMPALELAPGETDIGIESRNFDTFMQEMEGGEK